MLKRENLSKILERITILLDGKFNSSTYDYTLIPLQ